MVEMFISQLGTAPHQLIRGVGIDWIYPWRVWIISPITLDR